MNLFFSKGPRPALVSIQPSIQRTLGHISPGGKSAGGMSLTHLLHLSPTLKMSVILSPFHPYVFLLCMFCFLFCVFCVFVLFCLLFLPTYRFVYFLFFAYNFTNHSHRVETQLQLINIIWSFLYRASFQHMKWKTNRCHYFNFIHISTDLYMFRAHSSIFRRVHTAVHTTIGSVSVLFRSRAPYTEHATWTVQTLNQWLCEQLCELSWRWACGPETCRDPSIYE